MSKTLRCAIYTRKSSEEGLDQDFNSLEAQCEACEAYVRSQAHEGWLLIPDPFDDGGFSGGTTERPGLKRLMAMVQEGKVDVIVIYKIDRLTRSLTDFARLAETFDKRGVSFVSVTQQFNTTTSMGRLMLNVLLSFAQFEREITGERIRDKIAASKKKGMWLGGPIPIGYSVENRQLVINEVEAAAVRRVFELYLDEGNVPALLERLERERIKTPARTSRRGRASGGLRFTRGHLYKLLSNPLYIGRIAHKGVSHAGQHQAIISKSVWDGVQARLATNTQGERTRRSRAQLPSPPLLDGLLLSPAGNRMIPVFANKGARRYSYYAEQVSAPTGIESPHDDNDAHRAASTLMLEPIPPGQNRRRLLRLPAREIEAAVVGAVAEFLADEASLMEALSAALDDDVQAALDQGRQLAAELASNGADVARRLLRSVRVAGDTLDLEVGVASLRALLGLHEIDTTSAPTTVRLRTRLEFRRRGRQLKVVMEAKGHRTTDVDPTLVTVVARAFDWFERLSTGRAASITELAEADGFDAAYVSHVLPLAFLPPERVGAILAGQQPPELTADRLIWKEAISALWV